MLGEQIASSNRPFEIHVFISHSHFDKLMGFPFFLPNYIEGAEIFIYSPAMIKGSIEETLRLFFQHHLCPVSLGEVKAKWHFRELSEETLDIGDLEVETMKLNHPVTCLGYRLQYRKSKLVYATDHEPYAAVTGSNRQTDKVKEKKYRRFIQDADLLIADAQYLPDEFHRHRGWGHSTTTYALNQAVLAKVKQLAFFQHDPNRSDYQVDQVIKHYRKLLFDKELKLSLFPAQEGLEIEL